VFKSLADYSQEFIGISDPEFKPFYVNEAGIKLVGLESLEEACRMRVQDFFFPEDRRFIEEEFFPKVLQEGAGEVEIRFRNFKTGQAVWMIYNVFRVRDAQGRVSGYATVSREITERKRAEEALRRSEEKYRSLFNSLDEGFCVIEVLFDEEGQAYDYRFLDVNPAFIKQTGLADPVGKTIRQMVPEHEAHWFETYGRIARTGEPLRFQGPAVMMGRYYDVFAFRIGQMQENKVAILFKDIIERKRTEEALEQTRTMLMDGERIAKMGTWQWIAETGETVWSEGEFRLYGLEPGPHSPSYEELMSKHFHPEDAGTLDRLFREAVESGTIFENDHRIVHPDGTVRFLHNRAHPQFDAKGKLVGYVGATLDVTEQKQAEEAMRESKDRLEVLARTSSLLLKAADPQTVLEELCNEVRRFLKCEVFFIFLLDAATQLLKLNAYGGVDPQIAKQVETMELAGSVCELAAEKVARVTLENVDRSEDQRAAKLRQLGIRAYAVHPLLGTKGEVIGTLSFGTRKRGTFPAEDLDLMGAVADQVAVALMRGRGEEALRASEERLRQAIELAGLGTFDHDHVSDVISASRDMREMYGFGEGEEVTVPKIIERITTEDRERVVEGIRQGHDPSGEGRYELEHGIEVPRRGIRCVNVRAKTFFEGEGSERRAVRTTGTVQDITERKAFEAELQRLVDERTARLQELVGELEHFSYTITHDLKSPLRAMRGYSELAAMALGGAEGTQAKELLRRISNSAERMDSLISDALNYSRAVRQELPLEDVDAGALLRGMLDSYPEFQPNKAQIRVEGRLPVVLANEAGLTQCFSNLLGNAVKFVKQGEKPDIRVWAAEREEWVRIWVEDKGIGISSDMLPRVFDMFSRGSKEYEGTGIGLALVRKVTQRMGGKAGVESEDGKGSRFWIELKSGDAPAFDQAAARQGESAGSGSGTVLYVEDEESDAMFMKMAFEKKGLGGRLQLVTTGRSAIEYLSGSGEYGDREKYPVPGLVVLDLNLPQVSGFGVLEWMRNNPDYKRTPVVIFSSSTREDDQVKAKRLGADEFVTKPISGLKFGEVVDRLNEKWMERRRGGEG
jgi:PAS domain S-box-containing protein